MFFGGFLVDLNTAMVFFPVLVRALLYMNEWKTSDNAGKKAETDDCCLGLDFIRRLRIFFFRFCLQDTRYAPALSFL